MAKNFYKLKLPQAPNFNGLTEKLKIDMAHSVDKLILTPSIEIDKVIAQIKESAIPTSGVEDRFTILYHALSNQATERAILVNFDEILRASNEQKLFLIYKDKLEASFNSPEPNNFIKVLTEISATARNKKPSLRKGLIKINPDRYGFEWHFPDACHIQPSLSLLHNILKNRKSNSPLMEAVVAYVFINWIHPFPDANGRVSRVVFNSILHRSGVGFQHYIPIKELNFFAQQGHEIRLRYTLINNDWTQIFEYFSSLINIYIDLCMRKRQT
jgi:hypothetical protein